ncbi:UNVERIFIED_CONTAM: hypothetical protein NY100_05205 [Prevotella sp. 15_C9]
MGNKFLNSLPFLRIKCQDQHKFFALNACSKSQFVLSLAKNNNAQMQAYENRMDLDAQKDSIFLCTLSSKSEIIEKFLVH